MTLSRRGMIGTMMMGAYLPILARADTGMTTHPFSFVSEGRRLSGLVDVPAKGAVRATVIIVHGYGATDVADRTSWYDLRSRFTALGFATVIWDKPGCGRSEGTFDPNQPVADSAREVLAAAQALRDRNLPGSDRIGLWGISRAGWIAPMAITQDPKLAFWISVSGTDGLESFPYLLQSNLRIEGRTDAEIAYLMGQWRRGFKITRRGGSYAEYTEATKALRADAFMVYLTGNAVYDEAAFLSDQRRYMSGEFQVDEATGLMVYVPGFEAMLRRVNVPVLALFGELDSSVNWRATKALYSGTVGENPQARLTIRTFSDGNHNIQKAITGGLREMIEMRERHACDGYYQAMDDWLLTVA
jgi:pimeloyl-ACP methyl ester carboxylesterase